MAFFWVRFTDRKAGTIEAEGSMFREAIGAGARESDEDYEKRTAPIVADVRKRASKFGTVRDFDRLPYPSDPRLDVRSECPSFCYRPERCKGRTACPHGPSCTS